MLGSSKLGRSNARSMFAVAARLKRHTLPLPRSSWTTEARFSSRPMALAGYQGSTMREIKLAVRLCELPLAVCRALDGRFSGAAVDVGHALFTIKRVGIFAGTDGPIFLIGERIDRHFAHVICANELIERLRQL